MSVLPEPTFTMRKPPSPTLRVCCGRTARSARTAAARIASGRSRRTLQSAFGSAFTGAATASQFTVKVGTVFEHGRIPLHKFLQAVHLLC